MSSPSEIAQRWQQLNSTVAAAARASDRDPQDIRILAVSKTFPLTAVEAAWAAGARHFGENYVQEGVAKIAACTLADVVWHYIGPLQSNKTRQVASHFDWVHTIDRLKIARRLHEQRPAELPPLAVCLQVNISADPNKAGLAPDAVAALAEEVATLDRLQLRGLMTIPAADQSAAALQQDFARMAELFRQLQTEHPQVDTLSMGMSDDLTLAIAAGSTCIRVGRGIFGDRPRQG
ncbi:YggS family pyridoxal phosphate-dependent enzyme [Natronospirillum operosum]|uniref:Pyridoxal phosphate homeostasis protein n=1 Tax=Natronospirillum operosum TaxID=2759953 RepID=A0A4Z0WAQ1_9GAMM|nr:YggS family pyridoxal phosphate-dependent enzyme [Natronospirillum operosum]TGG90071.1 YggS family pyridoxal phosphate-dependent enzyme [Natronospirillum operosum]